MMNTPQTNSLKIPLNGNNNPKDGNPIAVLTRNSENDPTAVLTFSVGELSQVEPSNRVQLLPDGNFKTSDGRPNDVDSGHWLMDSIAFASLKANASLRKNDFMFDYEHQTLNADTNGKPAPASGWFNQLEYVPGQGLFAVNVDWTNAALKLIKEKEYRYISAVFAYDKKTGRPISLRHAALTNEPALDGMKALAILKNNSNSSQSQNNQLGEISMNKALALLLGLLGVAQDGEDFSDPAVLKAAQKRAKTAIAALTASATQLQEELDSANASVVALKAKSDDSSNAVDLSLYVPKATYDATVTQLAALKVEKDSDSIEQLLKENSDKVFESESQYLTDFGNQQGVAALKEMLNKRPAVAALKKTQTEGKKKPDGASDNDGELNEEQIAVCKAMGLDADQFKKNLENQGEG